MKQYHELLKRILDKGETHDDRTGVGTLSLFGEQIRFDLREGFPIVTTKKVPFRWVVEELLWMLSGSTYEPDLRAKGVDIWREWADLPHTSKFNREEGDLGPVYGWLWRDFGGVYKKKETNYICRQCREGDCKECAEDTFCKHNCMGVTVREPKRTKYGIDQIARLCHDLVHNPNSRRHLLTGWDPKTCDEVALPPCHTVSQYKVHHDDSLSCHLYARSIDSFLGLPFNICQYALLTSLLGVVTNHMPQELIISFGDVHIYKNHIKQVETLLSREPKKLPRLGVVGDASLYRGIEGILKFTSADLKLFGYEPWPKIEAEVAV